MVKSAFDKTIPNLENATPGFLLDEIAKMRVESARLKYLDGVYKEALKARLTPEQLAGKAPIEGSYYLGNFIESSQERVDSDAVKEYFKDDPEGLKKVMKLIPVLTLKADAKAVPDV